MLVIDDYSRMTWVAFIRNNSEAFEKFKIFKALAENQIGCNIKCIRSDRGGEFASDEFVDFCDELGIRGNLLLQTHHKKMEFQRDRTDLYSKWLEP